MAGELDGVADAYRAPDADYDDRKQASALEGTDYVVSASKLGLLHAATLGLYAVYWFYKHWRHQKLVSGSNIWPLPRAIFSVFYVAPLFKQLDLDARTVGYAPGWSPGAHAAIFIVVNVTARLLDKLSGKTDDFTPLDFVALVLPLLGMVPLIAAQKVVNLSVGDEHGRSNSQLGVGGWLLMLVGCAFWLLVLAGMLLPS